MWFIFAMLTLLCWGFFNFSLKIFADPEKLPYVNLASIYLISGSIMWLFLWLHQETISFHTYSLLLGALLGLCSATGNYCLIRAFETGISSIVAPLTSSNAIIVIVLSMLFFGERVSLLQGVAIFTAFTSIVLLNYSQHKEKEGAKDNRWLLYTGLTFLAFAGVNFVMKLAVQLQQPPNVILALGFTLAFSIYLGLCVKSDQSIRGIFTNQINFFAVLNPIGMITYGLALQHGLASLVCPITSSNSIVTVIFGLTRYKEKLNRYQLAAVIGTFVSIILLGMHT